MRFVSIPCRRLDRRRDDLVSIFLGDLSCFFIVVLYMIILDKLPQKLMGGWAIFCGKYDMRWIEILVGSIINTLSDYRRPTGPPPLLCKD